jgi:hypothetical protein
LNRFEKPLDCNIAHDKFGPRSSKHQFNEYDTKSTKEHEKKRQLTFGTK